MTESERFLAEMGKIQNRIQSNDKQPRNFGTSCLLHQAEIHLIDAIEPGTWDMLLVGVQLYAEHIRSKALKYPSLQNDE